ncbi:MAG: cytochrome d ubiquinol oxidase subunit [Pseudomonadota bacterium]
MDSPALDAAMLSRIQFAANISFHVIFPTVSIGLAWFLVYIREMADRSGGGIWETSYHFWVKAFALTFAFGVVSGVTMSFQFGTNWPGFMEKVGSVAGPLLSYEVLSAFFLEATFLGIMLWGQNRVSPGIYRLSVWLVAGGTTLSLFWILVLNSWMHTPVGYEIVDGRVVATDWLAIIFNPSMPYRTVHMFLASMLTAAFFVMGVAAYRQLKGHRGEDVSRSLKLGASLAALIMPLQIVVGDMHGLNTHEHQPAKIAAMEGLWQTEKGVPMLLFAIPDDKARTNHFEVAIPNLASLIITHELDGEIKGLNEFEGEHPPVLPVFWGFRVMVGTGMLMLALSWLSVWYLRRRGELPGWLLRVLVPCTFIGWVPTLAGWYVTEIGRQPFLVTGVLRTADAVSQVPASVVAGSLVTYLALYAVLIVIYVATLFYMARSGGGHHGYHATPLAGAKPATA